jgi:hypothetical protein
MRFAIVIAIFVTGSAHAQFYGLNGTGLIPGQQCPYNFAPGAGALNRRDPLSNLQSKVNLTNSRLHSKQQTLRRIDGRIKEARAEIHRVIKSETAMGDIERHYKMKGGQDSYQSHCGGGKHRSGSAGGQRVNAVYRPAREEAVARAGDPGRVPVPSEFCTYDESTGKYMNDWKHVIAEDGKMMDDLCDYEVPLSRHHPDASASRSCKHGLQKYYDKMAEREKVDAEVAALKEELDQLKDQEQEAQDKLRDRQEAYQDAIAEGQYCPYCAQLAMMQAQQRSAGVMPFMNSGFNIMMNFNSAQRNYMYGRPMPPPQMPWSRPIAPAVIRPGQPLAPNPMAYQARPYAAPIRGFSGIQPGFAPGQGFYGAGPGAMGPGTFGCQGTNMNGFGNPMAPQFMPFQNATANPWGNPFAMNPNQWNPNFNNGLLNPGYGPGWGPQIGNGVYNPLAPYMMNNGAFNMPPQYMPWNQPWANNAYAPYGNSFMGPNGVPVNAPWYGSPGLTYGLGNQYNLGATFPPIVNMPYSGYAPTPVTNLNYQMGLLKNQMGLISGLNAPAILPAPTVSSPIYNRPTFPNVAVPPAAPVPAAGGAPNVVVPGH